MDKIKNVLAFSCPHIPFDHAEYLSFLTKTQKQYKCTKIICLGDLFDNHAISYFESDPDGYSAGEEFKLAQTRVKQWIKAFPSLSITYGNHDLLITRQAKTHGFPSVVFKKYNDIWGLPETWVWQNYIIHNGIKYMHGTGKSGKYMHSNWANENMQSTVTGHGHSNFGLHFQASHEKLIFGMGVGCGIDIDDYAFQYGKNFARRPILGCGVILDNGRTPIPIAMKL